MTGRSLETDSGADGGAGSPATRTDGTDPAATRLDRAQAQVLGFVIVFAVAMTALTVYQVNVVPVKNEQVEFEHTETVERDIAMLQGQLREVGVTGAPRTVSVKLGTRYPERAIGISAPPASGRLRATAVRDVRIENAVADGEAGDYWDGSTRTFETRHLVYEPSYNYRDVKPRFRIEGGLIAEQQDGGTVVASRGGPVVGEQLNLLLVGGDYANAGQTANLDLRPVSAASEPTVVTDDGDPIVLAFESSLSVDVWRDAVGDEPAVESVGTDASGDIELTLETGNQYALRVPRAAIAAAGTTAPRYVTGDGATARSVLTGERETFTAVVHDRYGNPVPGATVDAAVTSGGGSLTTTTVTTDADGRATVVYEAPSSGGSAEVTLSIGGSGDAREAVYDLSVGSPGASREDTAGVGGRSRYDTLQRITVSQSEGLWTGVDTFDEVYLADADFRMADPTTDVVTLNVKFYVRDTDPDEYKSVRVKLKPSSSNDYAWQTRKVKILDSSRTYVNDARLTREAANRIAERNGRDGKVDLLDNDNYVGAPISSAEKTTIQAIASDDTKVYVQTMKGGVVELEIQ